MKIIGDIQKKGEIFGLFNRRYLELNLKDKLLIRYESINKYPNNPLETININSITQIKRLKNQNEYYLFEFSYVNQGKIKSQIYRLIHKNSRDKWLEYLLLIFSHFK